MPKIVDHEAYRQELLQGAFELLAGRGYTISMREIAAELGVSTGTLYHYFSGKEDLLRQMTGLIAGRDLVAAAAQLAPGATLREKLAVLGEITAAHAGELTSAILLSLEYVRQVSPEEAAAFFRSFGDDYVRELAAFLQLPESHARLLMAAVDGLLLHSWGQIDENELRAQFSLMGEMMAHFTDPAGGRGQLQPGEDS